MPHATTRSLSLPNVKKFVMRPLLDEQLWAAAYTAHPYQWPVVGWMVDIENWKMEDLRRHFEAGYSPANATMVVVGDVSFDEIIQLARKHIETIPSHDPPRPVTTREPDQLGERRVQVKKFAQLPILKIGYHVSNTKDPDFPALRILETILFSGQSSRLYQRVVDKDQLAISIAGGFEFSMDPTLFVITAQPKAKVKSGAIEEAIYEELERVRNDLVTEREFEKAKNIQLANFHRQMKTISGKANALGSYEVFFGDYRKLFTAADDLANVTRAELKQAARKYFTEDNRTVATLAPQPEPAPAKEKK